MEKFRGMNHECGGMALTQIEVKEMMRTENFWWNKENYCDSPHLRGDGFLPDGSRKIKNRNTNVSRCDICVQNVAWGSAGLAGPGRSVAGTDSDD